MEVSNSRTDLLLPVAFRILLFFRQCFSRCIQKFTPCLGKSRDNCDFQGRIRFLVLYVIAVLLGDLQKRASKPPLYRTSTAVVIAVSDVRRFDTAFEMAFTISVGIT